MGDPNRKAASRTHPFRCHQIPSLGLKPLLPYGVRPTLEVPTRGRPVRLPNECSPIRRDTSTRRVSVTRLRCLRAPNPLPGLPDPLSRQARRCAVASNTLTKSDPNISTPSASTFGAPPRREPRTRRPASTSRAVGPHRPRSAVADPTAGVHAAGSSHVPIHARHGLQRQTPPLLVPARDGGRHHIQVPRKRDASDDRRHDLLPDEARLRMSTCGKSSSRFRPLPASFLSGRREVRKPMCPPEPS